MIDYKKLECAYLQETTASHRESFAQFFTPLNIAKIMSEWVKLGGNPQKNILDPSFGLGVFYNYFNDKCYSYNAYETDEKIISYFFSKNGRRPNLTINNNNYLDGDICLYDGIICNPPYLKFHDYENEKYVSQVSNKFNVKLKKMSNLYTLFIIKSVSQIAFGGRLAYIVPVEFLNSDYGVEIKEYLLKSGTLRHISVFDPSLNLFDNALTTTCILFCANDEFNNSECSFSFLKNLNDIDLLNIFFDRYPSHNMFAHKYSNSDLDANTKWSRYYSNNKSELYENLVPFSKYAKATRGIATGANDYFVFNKSKSKLNGIGMDSLSPCICRSKDVTTPFFTIDSFNILLNSDKPIYIFNAQKTNEFDFSARQYIKKGEDAGIHRKHLTSTRKPWYAIEKRAPSPIWVGVFNRSGLRFIRNEANILNLTSFHCVYSNYNNIDLLFAYLSTDVAKAIFNDNKRVYGDGLNKFEPNDLNKGLMLDIDLLSDYFKNFILDLFYIYREKSISGDSRAMVYLKEINQIFTDHFLKK